MRYAVLKQLRDTSNRVSGHVDRVARATYGLGR